MSLAETPSVTKPRRRNTQPEQIGLHIEHLEGDVSLTVEIRSAGPSTQRLDNFEGRLNALEESTPSIGMVTAQTRRLTQLEEQMRNGGNGHTGA
jgi:hypothetical protein